MQQAELLPVETLDPRDDHLFKHVNAVALIPTKGGGKISVLERKLYNVLLHRAQATGAQDEYSARMSELVNDIDFDSKNTEHLKKALKNLMKTVVEWQSPTNGEMDAWEACVLLSGASIKKDVKTKAVTMTWRYDTRIREQLLSPDRYARLMMESITQLRSHASIALYEICARYVDNPGHKTARRHWRWWRPVLGGQAYDNKGEYRYFKRDLLLPAIAEINANTELEILPPLEFKERDKKTIADLQFEVRLKSRISSQAALSTAKKAPLENIEPMDLETIGWAIRLGVAQVEAEKQCRKHGAQALNQALAALEKRLAVPEDISGAVQSADAYLRAILRKKGSDVEKDVQKNQPPTVRPQKEIERNKAALIEEWLFRKKEHLCSLFSELPQSEQEELLGKYRQHLAERLPVLVKRFDSSGWNHKSLRGNFSAFLGESWDGAEWNKPTGDDLLAIALEKAGS